MKKTKAQLMRLADTAFSLYVRRRERFQCFWGLWLNDPCNGVHQCCHIIAKGSCSELRYDANNAVDGCYKHHMYGWHNENPYVSEVYLNAFREAFPKRWEYLTKVYAEYKLKQGTPEAFKPTKEHYIEMYKIYSQKAKELA